MTTREFWCGVGGTFTDGLWAGAGRVRRAKELSSGAVPDAAGKGSGPGVLADPALARFPEGFFTGHTLALLRPNQEPGRP